MDSNPPEGPRPIILPDMLSPGGVEQSLNLFLGYMPETNKGSTDKTGYLRLARTQSQFAGVVTGAELSMETGAIFEDTTHYQSVLDVTGHILFNHPMAISDAWLQDLQKYLHVDEYTRNDKINLGLSKGTRMLSIPNQHSLSHLEIAFAPTGEVDDGLTVRLYPRKEDTFRFPMFENQKQLIRDIAQSVPPTLATMTRVMEWFNSQVGGVLRPGFAFEKPVLVAWEGYDYIVQAHENGAVIYNKARFPQDVVGQVISWENGAPTLSRVDS